MARGDKSKYTEKQKRRAEKIARGYRERGTGAREAKRRAWATVNAESGGGEKSGSGRGRSKNRAPSRKGGKKGGRRSGGGTTGRRTPSSKSASRSRKK